MFIIDRDETTGEFIVHNGDDLVGKFDTHEGAFAAIAATFAEVPGKTAPTAPGAQFEITFIEGEESVDNRVIEVGATKFDRPTPLPLMWTNEQGFGHEGSVVVGRIDTLERVGADQIKGVGTYDSSDAATEAQRLVGEGMMTSWSPDIGNAVSELEITEVDADGFPSDFTEHLTAGTFLGGTIVPIQALTSAIIRNIGTEVEEPTEPAPPADAEEVPAEEVVPEEISASAVIELADNPPAVFFTDPKLDEVTPLQVTADGRVFGHVAPWGTCHIGRDDVCINAPNSPNDYAYFRTGSVMTEEGDKIATGVITLGTGHPPTSRSVSAQAAIEHYDHTGTGVADVVAGEDAHGIWISGALRPGVTAEQVRVLAASSLSGDWRHIGGQLEMVAALAVNVPGFPIPQEKLLVASGECMALVAAGVPQMAKAKDDSPDDHDDLLIRLAAMEKITRPLVTLAVEQLDKRMQVHA